MKKLKYYLQHVDGIWSIPLAFLIFWFVGLVLTSFFGFGTGTYDPGFIQPLVLASAVVIGATNVAVSGIYFTFRGFYRYLYGHKKNGVQHNPSKKDWEALPVIYRFLLAFGIFIYFLTAILIVYLNLV